MSTSPHVRHEQQPSPAVCWLPELVIQIAKHLPPNEVACTLRLVDKTAHASLKGCTKVVLSQPCPHPAFVWRWSRPSQTAHMRLQDRILFLKQVARAGVWPNLKTALDSAGCGVPQAVMDAAAGAGHVELCQKLLAHGGAITDSTLEAAARSGQLRTCQWLFDMDCPHHANRLLSVAAEAGREDLLRYLSLASGVPVRSAIQAVAGGCSLALLASAWLESPPGVADPLEEHLALLEAAVGSRVEWQAKVDWLLEQGRKAGIILQAHRIDGLRVGLCADGCERLAWLKQRGIECNPECVAVAFARCNNAVGVMQMLDEVDLGQRSCWAQTMVWIACCEGSLDVLTALHLRGHAFDGSRCAYLAARHGHMHVLEWLVGSGIDVVRSSCLATAACLTGRVALVEWLVSLGCELSEMALPFAARSGSFPLLRRLLELGCPPPGKDVYAAAAATGDIATLRCLKVMGFPFQSSTLQLATRMSAPQHAREWLVAHGCP